MSMPIPDTAYKAFSVFSEAHYGPSLLQAGNNADKIEDEITIGFYSEGEGTYGEFCIQFKKLGQRDVICAKLCVWDDAWYALSLMPELLSLLAANGSDSTVCSPPISWWKEQLLALGYRDITSRGSN